MSDPVFAEWMQAGLVWLPERGMGYYPVREAPYDQAYFEKYEGYAATSMGAAITRERAALVRRHAPHALVCDVGIGCGAFVEAMGCCGYDINPAAVTWLCERGAWHDPYETPVDALTCWDALEHIPDAARLVASARRWVFCALPIVPGAGPPPPTWKHFRPTEHCWYWTEPGLIAWMAAQGFACVEVNTLETGLGREDVTSFAFRREPASCA
jgi:hypothetical protein